MKIYIHEKGVVLAGKAWEIKQKLKEYGKQHCYVKDWIKHPAKAGSRSD
ncbi:Z-ring formation inhibitor MciZ [Bacillus sp. REN3]|nr:Z-ring formation inhibitor MciZ [Bacillus sp. REN3]